MEEVYYGGESSDWALVPVKKKNILSEYLDIKNGKIAWRGVLGEDIHSLYSSSNMVRWIELSLLRWTGDVVRILEGMSISKTLKGKKQNVNI